MADTEKYTRLHWPCTTVEPPSRSVRRHILDDGCERVAGVRILSLTGIACAVPSGWDSSAIGVFGVCGTLADAPTPSGMEGVTGAGGSVNPAEGNPTGIGAMAAP